VSLVQVASLSELRIRLADSKTAAAIYFAVVLVGLVVAHTWLSSSVIAYAGVFLYATPALFTWPFLDAAFSRYSREAGVNAPAQKRMPWVWCVLVGVLLSILIGALGS
jgi:hypothetical protein